VEGGGNGVGGGGVREQRKVERLSVGAGARDGRCDGGLSKGRRGRVIGERRG